MLKKEIFGAALFDCTDPTPFFSEEGLLLRNDSLFWFLLKAQDVYEMQQKILKRDFKLAFRVAWIYPFDLKSGKKQEDIYFLFAMYKGNSYYFNKDPIREKHIWKDVEWGARSKNYNPKGKDPGTVWIKIVDDGNAHTIAHEVFTPQEMVERIALSSLKSRKEKLAVSSKKLPKNSHAIFL